MSKNKNTPEEKVETGNDLDQLRNILYGNQARETEQRLDELEQRLEIVNRNLKNNFSEQLNALTNSSDDQFRAVQDKLAKTNSDFSQRIEEQIGSLGKQLADFRAESRQRDADLRQEMLALGAMLDKQKAGRQELGDLLVQLGQQIKDNDSNPQQDE
jgi:tetrahydromethanopterin S-methyltransferase subunit G